jgi:hypothetical protein
MCNTLTNFVVIDDDDLYTLMRAQDHFFHFSNLIFLIVLFLVLDMSSLHNVCSLGFLFS